MARLNPNRTAQSVIALERQAAITKQELAIASAQYGAGNTAIFEGFEPNTIRLQGFTGSWDQRQHKFVGQYTFVSSGPWRDGEIARMADFKTLPDIALQRAPKAKAEAKATTAKETPHVADL